MDPVQVDFPAEWDESIKTRVAERGKASVVEYLRELVQADIAPQYLDEETERLVIEGLDSPLDSRSADEVIAGLRQYAANAVRNRRVPDTTKADA